MKSHILLTARAEPRVILRLAEPEDLEDLRTWKNANKAGFFFQEEISSEMQKAWYRTYLERTHDYMFIVEFQGDKVGCMGFRVIGGAADVYNIIAAPGGEGRGLMRAAMAVMCSYAARQTRDIGCLVLKKNPAKNYYERCGFKITGDGGDHDIFKLDWSRFFPSSSTCGRSYDQRIRFPDGSRGTRGNPHQP